MMHALLWSQARNQTQVMTVDEMLSVGRDAYKDNRPPDYVPLWIGTEQEVQQAAHAMRNTLKARQAVQVMREAA